MKITHVKAVKIKIKGDEIETLKDAINKIVGEPVIGFNRALLTDKENKILTTIKNKL